jgi:hypothetical protein
MNFFNLILEENILYNFIISHDQIFQVIYTHTHIYVCMYVLLFLRSGLALYLGWPRTHGPPAAAFQMLGLQATAAMSSFIVFFQII